MILEVCRLKVGNNSDSNIEHPVIISEDNLYKLIKTIQQFSTNVHLGNNVAAITVLHGVFSNTRTRRQMELLSIRTQIAAYFGWLTTRSVFSKHGNKYKF